jgi:hypothetical protein
MPATTTIYELHARLLRDTFLGGLTDEDAFLVFALLHCYAIELTGPILSDRPDVREVSADTQRGVSEALTALWTDPSDPRVSAAYWYHRWNDDWRGYGHLERLTDQERVRLRELKLQLEQHPFVKQLKPDDWDPLG